MQPGTVEWELNKRRLRKEQREYEKEWAKIEAAHLERERELGSIWKRFVRTYESFWPE
jgi:hypothetical protein